MFRFCGGILSSGLIGMPLYKSLSLSHCSSCSNDDKSILQQPTTVIALYLTSKSKTFLKERLSKIGYDDYTADYVVIKRLTEKTRDNDIKSYKQYYGDKAAFRLKGIIKTDNGLVVGIGKVSTMYGEIQDPELLCSIPLYKDKNVDINLKDTVERSIDIAIQFQESKLLANNKSFWKGRLPSATILNQHYPSVGASFVAFPFPKQIVIDGHVCANNLIDNDGHCSYVTSDINIEDTIDDNRNKAECPVCTFMKAGPCKDECILWDECIQNINDEKDLGNCFTVTNNMMQCMIKHEYYDILTANMPINNQKHN